MVQTQHDWQGLAKAQFTPEARAYSQALAGMLSETPLITLGDYVRSRIKAAAFYSPLVLPQHQWESMGFAMSYFIGWVFGLDEFMDNCTDLSYIDDLITMITAMTDCPVDIPLQVDSLSLTHSPEDTIPGVPFTLMQFTQALNVLRRDLEDKAANENGAALFDKCLMEQVLPAMRTEAAWRLDSVTQVDFDTYLENGSYSICGIISVGLIDCILPDSSWYWDIGWIPTQQLGYATRLFNDIATRFRDDAEGRINAVNLYAHATNSSTDDAEQYINDLIEQYCLNLERLCLPHINVAPHDDPLYTMYYYIFYCGVISRMMYQQGDFVAEYTS